MKDIEISREQLDELIDQWIFNKRDREIVRERMYDGIGFEQLSDKHGLCVRQVKNIVYKAKEKIYRHIPSS